VIQTFLLGTIGIVMTLVLIQLFFDWQRMRQSVAKVFTSSVSVVALSIENLESPIRKTLETIAQYSPLYDASLPGNEQKKTLQRLARILEIYPNIYALYQGSPSGDLFELINLESEPTLSKIYRAPKGARWLHIRIFTPKKGHRVRVMEFFDRNFRLLAHRENPTAYSTLKRPWFLEALRTAKVVKTDVYLFSNLKRRGVTYAKRMPNGAVVAMDITVDNLQRLLQALRFHPAVKIEMLDEKGRLIAASDPQISEVSPVFQEAIKTAKVHRLFSFTTQNGERRLAMVVPVIEGSIKSWLAFEVSEYALMEPYLFQLWVSLGIVLVLIVLYLIWVMRMIGKIVRPIDELMEETHKVERGAFKEVRKIESGISELSRLSESMSAMSRKILQHQKAQQELIRSFVRTLAEAIDAKSPHTGNHSKRVPEIALDLLEAVDQCDEGKLADFRIKGESDREEFELSAWLHDCGKIVTPQYLLDKATKLQTIYDRIHEVRTRFEVLWRDIEITYLLGRLEGKAPEEKLRREKEDCQRQLQEEYRFIANLNRGEIPVDDAAIRRLEKIAQKRWLRHFDKRLGISDEERSRMTPSKLPVEEKLLADLPEHRIDRSPEEEAEYRRQGFTVEVPTCLHNDGEIYNLSIKKGTLTPEERFIVQEHVMMTIRMLRNLPWPEEMSRIPEYAGGHHEHLDGKGYPCSLTEDQLPIPARIMAMADIFEALTASDRPYRRVLKLSEALEIMAEMAGGRKIDAEIFALFVQREVYRDYVEKYLEEEQRDFDAVDKEALLKKAGAA
jgi:HD-GYP domain-containing protein (c-di-GMP phosphodiesterase class II)